jgi:5-methyltetrahydropteroyltriglutamate--homocysteine methyltransferase
MKRSTDRILVTHVGSLVRPMSIRNILSAREHGQPYDEAVYKNVQSMSDFIQIEPREGAGQCRDVTKHVFSALGVGRGLQ